LPGIVKPLVPIEEELEAGIVILNSDYEQIFRHENEFIGTYRDRSPEVIAARNFLVENCGWKFKHYTP
jgi:hypothetical protein